jgi:hypothetical protein
MRRKGDHDRADKSLRIVVAIGDLERLPGGAPAGYGVAA